MNKKSYTHMNVEERETLSVGLAQCHLFSNENLLKGKGMVLIRTEK